MNFFQTLKNLSSVQLIKLAVVAIVVLVVISFVSKIFEPTMPGLMPQFAVDTRSGMMVSEQSAKYAGEYGMDASEDSVSLSIRNIAPSPMPPVDGDYTPGNDAEAFEVTSYSAGIETRDLDSTCNTIADLKSKDYVIFENSNKYDKGCSYRFKVATAQVGEVLAVIEGLHPRDFNTNTETIKKRVDDYTSQEDILKNKLSSIDTTLSNAVVAYDEIARLATQTQDVESLTKIISSKVAIIERLTQERINITAQLEKLGRSKADQLDRLAYIYFDVYAYEQSYIDGEEIKDSWIYATKQALYDINEVVQDLSIGLVALAFFVIQYVIYFFILLFVAKYGWRFAKYAWRK
jgi:hypothetical protein